MRTNHCREECWNVLGGQWLNLLLQGHSFIARLEHSHTWAFAHCRHFVISDICDLWPLRMTPILASFGEAEPREQGADRPVELGVATGSALTERSRRVNVNATRMHLHVRAVGGADAHARQPEC